MNPEQNETFFGSPHIPFYHFLFYASELRPQAALGSLWRKTVVSSRFSVPSSESADCRTPVAKAFLRITCLRLVVPLEICVANSQQLKSVFRLFRENNVSCDGREDYVWNHGGHGDHGGRTKDTTWKGRGASWRLAPCCRGSIPSFSVPSVISVVEGLLVAAGGRAGLISVICLRGGDHPGSPDGAYGTDRADKGPAGGAWRCRQRAW